MKILIINTLYYPQQYGGAEVSVKLLASNLSKQGHHVRVLSLTKNIDSKSLIDGVESFYYKLPNIYWPFEEKKKSIFKKIIWHIVDTFNIKAFLITKENIKEFNPDVVHTNNLAGWSVSVWFAATFAKKPIIHTSRDYYLIHHGSSLYKSGKILNTSKPLIKTMNFPKKLASRLVTGYVGISDFILNLHIKNHFFRKSLTTRIYNAVDICSSEFKDIVKHTNIDHKLRVGFIGRLTEEKGFDIFVSLADKFKNKYDFCAAGNFTSNSKFDVKDLILLGHVPITDFLNNVDIIVMPVKWHEPFGRVVVEGAMAGKLVIATPMGGITELSKYFSNVLLVEDIVQDFDKAVQNFTFTDYDNIDLQFFSNDKITNDYLSFYNKVYEKCKQ